MRILFMISCPVCTWSLLPFLIGAWLLGLLFWLISRPKYTKKINNLSREADRLKANNKGLEDKYNTNLSTLEKVQGDYNALDGQMKEQLVKLNGIQFTISNLEEELVQCRAENEGLNLKVEELNLQLVNEKNLAEQYEMKASLLEKELASLEENSKKNPEPVNVIVTNLPEKNPPILEEDDDEEEELEVYSGRRIKIPIEHLDTVRVQKIGNIEFENNDISAKTIEFENEINEELEVVEHKEPTSDANEDLMALFDDVKTDTDESKYEDLYTSVFSTDDLQIFEGVDADIEQTLKESKIYNWLGLSDIDVSTLEAIISDSGADVSVKTLPIQADLAYQRSWEELIRLQRNIDSNGMESENLTPSKVESLWAKKMGFSSANPTDLKVVDGIGEKVEGILKQAGISNWAELSNSSIENIKLILESSGRYSLTNPSTWPKQARLAHQGEWAQLKIYQDRL